MFGFLKDKLKSAIGKFSKDVEKESTVEKKEVLVEVKEEKKEEQKIVKKDTIVVAKEEKKEEKKGFFSKIFSKKDSEDIVEEKEKLLHDLEEVEIVEEPVKKKIEPVKEKIVEKPKEIIVNKKIEVEYDPSHTHSHDHGHSHSHDHSHPHTHAHEEVKKSELTKVNQELLKGIEKEIKILDKIKTPKVEEKKIEIKKETPKPVKETKVEPVQEEKKGFFTRITETFTKFNLSEEKFEELFWELEVVLLENNVAVEVIDKIKQDMKKELMAGKINRSGVEDVILKTLKNSVIELFDVEKIDLVDKIKEKRKQGKPYIITIIGVNGSGKTTSIAKLTHLLQGKGLKVVLAASDTFRAAAIQQLEEHANKLNVKLVKHDYNSDPAAVGFDAVKYAEARGMDVVIIDTAGRLHSNTNLMRELEKVVRVCTPDIKIFVGESITGNDCVEQAKEFDKAVGIDAIILAKADVDEKGGAAISVSYILQRPILYLGTGQTYDDLKEFDSNLIIESLGL